MGAAASKNESESPPTSSWMQEESVGEHKGPAAMTQGPSGISVTSSRTSSIKGSAETRSPTSLEYCPRSTASAPPAGTAASRAQESSTEPMRSSSIFSKPAALSNLVDLNEFEHTSSARPSVVWAGEVVFGRISMRRTGTPRYASESAHSLPASPPPTTVTVSNRMASPLSFGQLLLWPNAVRA